MLNFSSSVCREYFSYRVSKPNGVIAVIPIVPLNLLFLPTCSPSPLPLVSRSSLHFFFLFPFPFFFRRSVLPCIHA